MLNVFCMVKKRREKYINMSLVLILLIISGCAAYSRANLRYLDKNIFAKIQKNIFSKKCSTCHQGKNTPHGIKFEKYENLVNDGGHHKLIKPYHPEESQLFDVVLGGIMPPKPNEKLQKEEIALIKEWICRGAPKSGLGKEPAEDCMKK